MKTFTTTNLSTVAENANEASRRLSANGESSNDTFGKLSANGESSNHAFGKLSATGESSNHTFGRVSASGESSPLGCGLFSTKKMNQQQQRILTQRLFQVNSEQDNHFAERFSLCLSVFACKKQTNKKTGLSPAKFNPKYNNC